jgi:deoxyribodipyrimidine photo-lyase
MPATAPKWGIHWFRRDLRIFGNEALRENCERHQGRVLGLFCFDSKFLSRPDFSHVRFAFFLKTLEALRAELRAQGGDLLVVDGLPQKAFPKLVRYFHQQPPSLISWNRDYEPFARKRDQEMQEILDGHGIETFEARDHLLFEPHEILKKEGSEKDFYQVFSPYGRKWFAKLATAEAGLRLENYQAAKKYYQKLKSNHLEKKFDLSWRPHLKQTTFPFEDSWQHFYEANQKKVAIEIPEAGSLVAYQKLLEFAKHVENYKKERDFPSVPGTSKLSMYLKNGSLTSSQILWQVLPAHRKLAWKSDSGLTQFVKELVWREFYYSILYHRPDVETGSFLAKYRQLAWANSTPWFKKWQAGLTGFPIIDAGMRELKETGWMHNRVRMIVASFLTKDLLVDWRWGENHFMKLLLDGDLAANNGGWQWAASTGCDPQPYFRIFNPWLQSKKFDPDGAYIKRFVPELREAQARSLHDPIALAKARPAGYPKPVVIHEIQRPQALRLYRA